MSQPIIARGAISAINHVLDQHAWARERLAPFSGLCLEMRCAPLPELRLEVLASGKVSQANSEASSDLVVTLRPAAIPLLLLRRDEAALREVEFSGAAGFASAVQFLFLHLEWELEEDLSHLFGDVLAHRLAGAGRGLVAWQREAGLRLGQNFAEYWTEEDPMLARPDDVQRFSGEVDALADDAARLEQRLNQLGSRRSG